MNKPVFKSKTVNSSLVVILMTAMSLLGIGEEEMARTYDTIGKESKTETTKELVTLIAAGGAIYGRTRVGKGKDE